MPAKIDVQISRYKKLIDFKFELLNMLNEAINFIDPAFRGDIAMLQERYNNLNTAKKPQIQDYKKLEATLEEKVAGAALIRAKIFDKNLLLGDIENKENIFEHTFQSYAKIMRDAVQALISSKESEILRESKRSIFEMRMRWLNEKKIMLFAIVFSEQFKNDEKNSDLLRKIENNLKTAHEFTEKYNDLFPSLKFNNFQEKKIQIQFEKEKAAILELEKDYEVIDRELNVALYDILPYQAKSEIVKVIMEYNYLTYQDKTNYIENLKRMFDRCQFYIAPYISMLNRAEAIEGLNELIEQKTTFANIAKALRKSRFSGIFPGLEDKSFAADKKLFINYDILKKNILEVYKNLMARKIPFGDQYMNIATLARALAKVKANEVAITEHPESEENKSLINELYLALNVVYQQSISKGTALKELKFFAESYLKEEQAEKYLPEKFTDDRFVGGDDKYPSSATNRSSCWSMNKISEHFVAAAGPVIDKNKKDLTEDFFNGMLEYKPKITVSLGVLGSKDFIDYTALTSVGKPFDPVYLFDYEAEKLSIKNRMHQLLHEVKIANFPLADNTSLNEDFKLAHRIIKIFEEEGLIEVHCHAGVGRTGHFILLGELFLAFQQLATTLETMRIQELKVWEVNDIGNKMEEVLNRIRKVRYLVQEDVQFYNALPELLKLVAIKQNINEAQFKEFADQLELVRFEKVKEQLSSDRKKEERKTRRRSIAAPPPAVAHWQAPSKSAEPARRVSIGNYADLPEENKSTIPYANLRK